MALSWLLIVITSVATVAQPASDEDVAERMIEIPGSGVGVTLPVMWRVASVSPEGGGEHVILANDVAGKQSCSFGLLADSSSAERAAQETVARVEAQGQYEVVDRILLNAPSGSAVRVAYRAKDAPDDARFVINEYYLAVPGGVVNAYCQAQEPPADRFLSVIDSITPVPADPPYAAPFDPRVEVADHGFSVDFSAEWLVRWWSGRGPVLGGDLLLRAGTLTVDDHGHGGYDCYIEDDTVLSGISDADSLEAWQATLVTSAEAQGIRASDPVVTKVNLSSGHAVRVDWQRWRGESATAWVYLDGDGHAALALLCRSDQPPDDGWRSIAETLEFLPAPM